MEQVPKITKSEEALGIEIGGPQMPKPKSVGEGIQMMYREIVQSGVPHKVKEYKWAKGNSPEVEKINEVALKFFEEHNRAEQMPWRILVENFGSPEEREEIKKLDPIKDTYKIKVVGERVGKRIAFSHIETAGWEMRGEVAMERLYKKGDICPETYIPENVRKEMEEIQKKLGTFSSVKVYRWNQYRWFGVDVTIGDLEVYGNFEIKSQDYNSLEEDRQNEQNDGHINS